MEPSIPMSVLGVVQYIYHEKSTEVDEVELQLNFMKIVDTIYKYDKPVSATKGMISIIVNRYHRKIIVTIFGDLHDYTEDDAKDIVTWLNVSHTEVMKRAKENDIRVELDISGVVMAIGSKYMVVRREKSENQFAYFQNMQMTNEKT